MILVRRHHGWAVCLLASALGCSGRPGQGDRPLEGVAGDEARWAGQAAAAAVESGDGHGGPHHMSRDLAPPLAPSGPLARIGEATLGGIAYLGGLALLLGS